MLHGVIGLRKRKVFKAELWAVCACVTGQIQQFSPHNSAATVDSDLAPNTSLPQELQKHEHSRMRRRSEAQRHLADQEAAARANEADRECEHREALYGKVCACGRCMRRT